MNDAPVDFAISYAGEDEKTVNEVVLRLRELGFDVFYARDVRSLLVGSDGENIFERLFTEAKEVVAFISDAYRRKHWPRFEWDVIKDRKERFIAVRLDDTRIVGLPSNVFYMPFQGSNYDEIVRVCVDRLRAFEAYQGIRRPSDYETILNAIRNESRGALAEAYQLVKDKRKRDPLAPLPLPEREMKNRLINETWVNFSVVKRRSVKIAVPSKLSQEELRAELQGAAIQQFNAFRPDAVMVLGYIDKGESTNVDVPFSAGRAVLAPFGKWEKAQDGVAYNIPSNEFEFTMDFCSTYPFKEGDVTDGA